MSESEIINDLKRESNDDENEQTLKRTQPTFEDNQVIVFFIYILKILRFLGLFFLNVYNEARFKLKI
jgi:hypothetical protein